MQPNPDYNNIVYTIYVQWLHAGFTDTIKCVYAAKIKFHEIKYIILIIKHTAKFTKWQQP